MSGVNSKCSRGDLTPPRPKRLKQQDSTLVRIGSTEQMKPPTSPESPVGPVLKIPDKLLADILGYFAADCDLEELLNLRLVSKMFNREVYSALKANHALLPWIVLTDNSMHHVETALSRTQSGSNCVVKSLESYRRNFAPGCGLPIKLVANRWTRKLTSFLHNYSKEIISFFICGKAGKDYHGFPEDLGWIELPALEHAPFSAVCDFYNKEGFVEALAFWKKLVEASKILKTWQVDIRIQDHDLSPDDHVFDLVEWSRVNSLECSDEFFAKANASNELLGLLKLELPSTFGVFRSARVRPISLEKVANLTDMKLGRKIEWILNHQMKNLKVLTLEDTTITCGQSPSIFLPNLEKIAVRNSEFLFTDRSAFSCLINSGRGVYENVAELALMEEWNRLDLPITDVTVQICDCFPKLTKLEWESEGSLIYPMNLIIENYAFMAAPVIFSKLDLLTRLKLRAPFLSGRQGGRELVELVMGIRIKEIPSEEDSWPAALTGNPRSITNLKHLQSFDLQLTSRQIVVSKRRSNFLFTAAFRTMTTLNDLYFKGIIFEDTSCATEWQQLGRTIKIMRNDASSNGDEDNSESSSESDDE